MTDHFNSLLTCCEGLESNSICIVSKFVSSAKNSCMNRAKTIRYFSRKVTLIHILVGSPKKPNLKALEEEESNPSMAPVQSLSSLLAISGTAAVQLPPFDFRATFRD